MIYPIAGHLQVLRLHRHRRGFGGRRGGQPAVRGARVERAAPRGRRRRDGNVRRPRPGRLPPALRTRLAVQDRAPAHGLPRFQRPKVPRAKITWAEMGRNGQKWAEVGRNGQKWTKLRCIEKYGRNVQNRQDWAIMGNNGQ